MTGVIHTLFAHYLDHPDAMEWVAGTDPADLATRVTDYVAGMTDRFCIRKFEELTVPREFTVPAEGKAGFTRLDSRRTSLNFTNQLSETLALNNQLLENGAGIALGDVDGDGWCDIYLCGAENSNKLFRNLGDWKFEDITDAAGVACVGQFSTGAALVDLDGDGDLDLLVNGLGVGTRCFLNDGRGHFSEDNASGLKRSGGATSLALADVDGDGDLDLYVTNYRVSSARHDRPPPKITARIVEGNPPTGEPLRHPAIIEGQMRAQRGAKVTPHEGEIPMTSFQLTAPGSPTPDRLITSPRSRAFRASLR